METRLASRLALALLAAQLWLAPASAAPAQPGIADARGGPDFASALLRETSVVVSITTTHRAAQANLGFAPDSFAVPAQRPTSRDPWDRTRRTDQERGLSSGIVISSDGEILTNAHAVADVDRVVVRLADGRQFAGKVIGIDRTTDVALLKIEAQGLPTAVIGNSGRLAAGEWVVAIGSPFGLDSSATAGLSVLEARGAASRAGIQADDLIVAVGDRPVRDIAAFDTALAAAPSDRPVALLVLRAGTLAYLAIEQSH